MSLPARQHQGTLDWATFEGVHRVVHAFSSREKGVLQPWNFNNTLISHFDGEQHLTYTINRDIVDIIIGDMMFNPDDEELAPTRERALRIFKLLPDAHGDGDDGEKDMNR